MIDQLKTKTTQLLADEPDERNEGIEPAENAVAFIVALCVSVAARNAIQSGWRAALKRDPPKNPTSPEVDWRDALLWGAVSGAAVGAARIISRRASSSAYRTVRSGW